VEYASLDSASLPSSSGDRTSRAARSRAPSRHTISERDALSGSGFNSWEGSERSRVLLAYAEFEASQGEVDASREHFQRALSFLEPASSDPKALEDGPQEPSPPLNPKPSLEPRDRERIVATATLLASWGTLEADPQLGADLEAARELLNEGLDVITPLLETLQSSRSKATSDKRGLRTSESQNKQNPYKTKRMLPSDFVKDPLIAEALSTKAKLMLMLGKVDRLSGDLEQAGIRLEECGKILGHFDLSLLKERALWYRSRGEKDLARSLDVHIRSMLRLKEAKLQGLSGWKAWETFFKEAQTEERRTIARKAHLRKVELGLWEKVGKPTDRVGYTPPAWQRQDAERRREREDREVAQSEAQQAERIRLASEEAVLAPHPEALVSVETEPVQGKARKGKKDKAKRENLS
jgi:hypothetical protein